jgi:hypothetical protein
LLFPLSWLLILFASHIKVIGVRFTNSQQNISYIFLLDLTPFGVGVFLRVASCSFVLSFLFSSILSLLLCFKLLPLFFRLGLSFRCFIGSIHHKHNQQPTSFSCWNPSIVIEFQDLNQPFDIQNQPTDKSGFLLISNIAIKLILKQPLIWILGWCGIE